AAKAAIMCGFYRRAEALRHPKALFYRSAGSAVPPQKLCFISGLRACPHKLAPATERILRSLAGVADDCGFEFGVVGAPDEHFVALETDGDRVAQNELTRSVAVGRGRFVFADVLHTLDADHDGGVARSDFLAMEDFGLGLNPVLHVTAGNSSAMFVDFTGATADGLL